MTASGTSHIKACRGHADIICPAIAVAELEQIMLQGDPTTESINQRRSSLATVHYLLLAVVRCLRNLIMTRSIKACENCRATSGRSRSQWFPGDRAIANYLEESCQEERQ